MFNGYAVACLFFLYLISIILFLVGKKHDRENEGKMWSFKHEGVLSYTMKIRKADCMASVILTLLGLTLASFPILFNDLNVNFLILMIILCGWAVVIQLGETVAKFCWKVVVNGDQFTVYSLLKNVQTYNFNDIYFVTETITLVNQNITKFYESPIYEVIVGESPALRSSVFSLYDNVIGYELFVDKLKSMGKIKKGS